MNKIIITFYIIFISSISYAEYIPKRDFSICYTASDYAKAIQIAITDNWSRPESDRNGLLVQLQVSIQRDGVVDSIRTDRSSGNKEFDESAIKAIHEASPFIEITGLRDDVYNKDFKKLKLVFTPIDLPE